MIVVPKLIALPIVDKKNPDIIPYMPITYDIHIIKECQVPKYAEDLGYEYMSASNKDEFAKVVSRFVSSEKFEKPFLFEVFTETKDESDALEMILNMVVDKQAEMVSKMKNVVRGVVGAKGVEVIKKILK